MDLTMVYVIRSALLAVKREMDEKGMSFDEYLRHYEEGIKILEQKQGTREWDGQNHSKNERRYAEGH